MVYSNYYCLCKKEYKTLRGFERHKEICSEILSKKREGLDYHFLKEGKIFTDPYDETKFRVYSWIALGEGKIQALDKEEIKNE